MKISIDGCVHTCYIKRMPDQRARDKRKLSLWVTREDYAKLQTLAKQENTSMSEIITDWIALKTKNVELTAEQYEEIYKAMRNK